MAGIVERLRDLSPGPSAEMERIGREAAAEIERLRAEVETWVRHAKTAIWSDSEECKLLTADNERLRAALDLYRESVRIDVTMEGPKFMGSNVSALKRAWDADRAALEVKHD